MTVGFLLGADLENARWVTVIPLLWAGVGGPAGFLLGIHADVILALAGVLLLIRLLASFGGLREEAGKLGANAIVLGEIRDPGTGERVLAAVLDTYANRRPRAIVVYVPSLERRRAGGSAILP